MKTAIEQIESLRENLVFSRQDIDWLCDIMKRVFPLYIKQPIVSHNKGKKMVVFEWEKEWLYVDLESKEGSWQFMMWSEANGWNSESLKLNLKNGSAWNLIFGHFIDEQRPRYSELHS